VLLLILFKIKEKVNGENKRGLEDSLSEKVN